MSESLIDPRREEAHDAWLNKMLPVRPVPTSPRVRGGRGYLMIDNRASGGTLQEMNTMTCAHCGVVVVLNPERTRERGYCNKCHAYICDRPGCHAGCFPQSKAVDLSMRFGQGISLGRGENGEILDDMSLWEKTKVY